MEWLSDLYDDAVEYWYEEDVPEEEPEDVPEEEPEEEPQEEQGWGDWLGDLYDDAGEYFSGTPEEDDNTERCPYEDGDENDPSDTRPRVSLVLALHPHLFEANTFPERDGFQKIDGNEFPEQYFLADGDIAAALQVRLLRMNVGCGLPGDALVTATSGDHFNEGEVVISISNTSHGFLLYKGHPSGSELRIPVSEIDAMGNETPDTVAPTNAIRFVPTRDIGTVTITAEIEGACSYIYCGAPALPTTEKVWRTSITTGSRVISGGMSGFDVRKAQWYLRRFKFLTYIATPGFQRDDSSHPYSELKDVLTDGVYTPLVANTYKDFTIVSGGTLRNQANQAVAITYTAGATDSIDKPGITEFSQWEDNGFKVEPYFGTLDANSEAGGTSANDIRYAVVIRDDEAKGYIAEGTRIGEARAIIDDEDFVMADEIRTAVKIFNRDAIVYRVHDADPNGLLDAEEMHDGAAGSIKELVRHMRREQEGSTVFGETRDVYVHSGYRSHAEQDDLYSQGRTTPGPNCVHNGNSFAPGTCPNLGQPAVPETPETPEIPAVPATNPNHPLGYTVTGAEGGESNHNFGLAADVVFCDDGGNPTWGPDVVVEAHWARLGHHAGESGLSWGGDWAGRRDYPHVYIGPDPPTQEMQNAYNNQAGTVMQKLEAAWAVM